MSKITCCLVLVTISVFLLGCSSGTDYTEPAGADISACYDGTDSNHVTWGTWDVYFDPVTMTINLKPARNAQFHLDVGPYLLPPMCDDCVNIIVTDFNPDTHILEADVTIFNYSPYTVYDVRGIFRNTGVGHTLLNPDDYVSEGGAIPGLQLAPFRAYAKDEPNRAFGPHAKHTEKFIITVPTPPKWHKLSYTVDVCLFSNCEEPYTIDNFTQTILTETIGSTADIQVDIFDWQDNANEVIISVPEITGEDVTYLNQISGNTWGVEITNNTGASAGDYDALIKAKSANSGELALYDIFTITVS